ncbi:hypothetical protein GFS60_00184 [Rhodococcus sp. WAY2]|nr:hypothetical protein GFS60_00184 [Rhodococcus sp. WAY2]
MTPPYLVRKRVAHGQCLSLPVTRDRSSANSVSDVTHNISKPVP